MNPILSSYFPNSHAVLIGINGYQKVSPLRNAVRDVQRVAEVLEHQTHGFQVHPLLIDASYKEIMELLTQTLPKTIGQGDRLLFYFAGHGIAVDSQEEGIPEGYLLPADADPHDTAHSISMSTLRQQLEILPCKHVLIVLDCCFSGAFRWTK